ncbi:EamA family transporter [Streptomyces fungicidicus]|uniref:EamA family transporter n=1 Tax=Streptomyces fungicidicus TaxID=68203 RepID=UPI0036637EB4
MSTGPAPLLGSGYALLSAAGYAGVTLLGRFAGRENAGGAFESTVTGFAVGTVCLPPTALLEGLQPDMERPAWTAGLILYLGAVPTALACPLLCVVRATTASVVALVEPLAAAVVGSPVFGERLNANVLTGRVLQPLAVLFRAADEGVGRAASRRAPSADHGRRTWPPALRAGD